jgi:Large polyvalent protein associated domain 38
MDPLGMSERGYIKIPMPYLMNGIFNWGRAASRAARGKYTMGELMKTGGMTMVDSLNPLGGSNSWLNWVAPSVLDPVVDLYMNEDFTGKPIAPPVSPYDNVGENRSQQYWNNTHPLYVSIADYMSVLTGRQGDFIPGAMEASPNQVEYAVDWVTGGTGTFLARAGRLIYGGATGTLPEMEIESTDIPFLRKAYGSITKRNDLQDYIEGRDQVLRIRKALQDARKEGDNEGYMNIKRMYPKEASIAGRINAIENARRKKSTQIKKIRDNTRISDAEKERRIKLLKERQDVLVGQGNEMLTAID